jgi:hypothetical protein
MKIQEYVKEQIRLLNKFEQHWEKRSLRQPQEYPSELASGDWDEQFHSFLESFTKESGK